MDDLRLLLDAQADPRLSAGIRRIFAYAADRELSPVDNLDLVVE